MDQKTCSSCVKEPTGTIPISRIIEKLDSLFAKNDMDEAGRVLEYWEKEARTVGDDRALLEILSEELGFYRKIADKEKGLKAVHDALSILSRVDDNSVPYATIYLNAATTMKAFGQAQDAIIYYDKAKELYEKLLPKGDVKFSGLFNNYATALMDLKRYNEGIVYYKKAIELLNDKGIFPETAISYMNLANLYYDQSIDESIDREKEIEDCLEEAMSILDDPSINRDGDYAYICTKCAEGFGYFGYFLQKQELEDRANKIYSK